MILILNQAQAEAVYGAMCALNNVGGRARIDFESHMITVIEYPSGSVHVVRGMGGLGNSEVYDDQAAFTYAYGLSVCDEWQSDVAAAAGGLTQTAIER